VPVDSGIYIRIVTPHALSGSQTQSRKACGRVELHTDVWRDRTRCRAADNVTFLNQGNRKLSIRLVDTNGKTVLENNAPVNSIPLSLKKLPAGIYLLMITDIKKRETLVKTILRN